MIRKEKVLLEKKKLVVKTISEIKDTDYIPELVSLLWDSGIFVEARVALVSMGDLSLPLLIDALKEVEDRSVRMRIIDVILKIGDRAISEALRLLDSDEWYNCRSALLILGELKADSAVDKIGKLLEDKSEQAQLEVVDTLNKIGSEGAKSYLKRALDSPFPRIVIEVMKILPREDVREKLGILIQWLKEKKEIPKEQRENFRIEIISILGRVGDDTVVESLKEILDERSLFKGDSLLLTKESALRALGQIKTERAIEALKKAANHKDPFISSTAQEILKRSQFTTNK